MPQAQHKRNVGETNRWAHEALIAAKEYVLPTDGWPSGVYFWQFFAEEKSLVAGKAVKR